MNIETWFLCGVLILALGCGGSKVPSSSATVSSPAAVADTSTPEIEKATDVTTAPVAEPTTTEPVIEPPAKEPEPAIETVESPAEPFSPFDKDKGEPIDLTAYYHSRAADFDRATSHPWRDVPRGPQTFGNVNLDIQGRICLWGQMCAQRGLMFPEYVEEIAVGRKFGALYVYHATFHNAADGTPVVDVIINYDQGKPTVSTICYGTDVRDWYLRTDESEEISSPKSKRVWQGRNSLSQTDPPGQIRFFITEIANPRPEDMVKSLDLVSCAENPTSCILAMTTGPAGLLKVDP